MMKRPRLRRPVYLSLLAIAGLLFLSYFPLAKIRAANAGAAILPSAGKPLVNLKNPQSLKITYAGAADAVAALQGGVANPTALVAADFNADGAMDVVAGYSTKNGGVLALMRGNPDAYAPTDASLYAKAMQGRVPATFLSKASVFDVPVSPDLLATGDFNRDGYKDVLVAARGGALYLLAGDGHGNLLAAQLVALTGQVTAMATTGDGHVAVSLDGVGGPQLAILNPGSNGLTEGATYTLPARGNSVAWGNLGGGADVAVGAGTNVVLVYNALSASAQTESVNLPFTAQALALGDFIWDRDGRTEISVLGDDGSIHILQHGTLNTTPLTPAELPARRAAIRGHQQQPATTPNPTGPGPWTVAKHLPYVGSAPSGPVSSSAFNSPRLASSPTQDLMVLDAGRGQLNILDTSGKAASPSAGVSFSGTPVAVLALPNKINSDRDIIVLTSSQSAPTLVTSNASIAFNVNTTADIDSIGACTSSTTSIPSTLSLREAVCLANNFAPDTATINIPPGTYQLALDTGGESGELEVGGASVGYSLSIVGAGSSNTIIQQKVTDDRVLEEDVNLLGDNPLSISAVSLSGGNCTNANGSETPPSDCDFGGGAILAGGIAGDDLTLTNVVISNNSSDATTDSPEDNGGAVNFAGPGLTISNSTFSSNTADLAGGGVYFDDQAAIGNAANGSLTITNSSFTSNTAADGGGGIWAEMATGDPETVTGSTFTGNKSTNGTASGGGIFSDQEGTTATTVTVSNSRIVGNFAGNGGNGVAVDSATAVLANNWWGCNAGPGGSGCDTVVMSGGGSVSPVLTLSLTPSATQVLPDGSATLTAAIGDGGTCSGYVGNACYVPDGTPVTSFAAGSLGTLGATSSTFTSGKATAQFNAGSTAGADTASVTVDNQTVSTTINVLDTVVVATNPSGLAITVDSVSYTAPQTFNWVVGSSHTISTSSPQTGSPGSQYVFSSWSQGGSQSQSVTAPSATTTYTANFTQQFQLTTQASPSVDGSVTPASGSYFAAGASIPVTATANAGFQFSNWTSTGGSFGSATSASTNFTMPGAPATVTGNFAPVIVATPTTTSVSSNNNPSFTAAPGNSVTFTATVTSNTTVNEGTVTFSDTANDFTCSGGNTVPVSNGQASCTTSFTAEGSNSIAATYNGTVNFQGSGGNITQGVNNHTVVNGNQFCNPGAIAVPGTAGSATPYPSDIFVSGLGSSIGKVTVMLNNISSSNIKQTDLLLVGPTGAAIVPFAAVGDGSTIGGVNVTLDDAAASLIPGGSPLTTGSYQPTSITGSTSLIFPAPAPLVNASNYAATDGAATLTSTFQNTAPNGTWALYAMDNSGNGAATIGGGWCVNITPATAALTVTKSVTSTGPYNTVGQFISYQFVAKNTGNVTLNAVGITDTQTAPAGSLTSGPTCQSLSGPTGTCSGSTTTLVPGQSATFTATYTITQADLNNGSVNDSATASGTPPTGPAVTSTPSTATVTTTSAPAVTATKSVTSTGPYDAVGQVISYQFVARNTGNVTLNAVGITDTQTAPAGSLTSGPTCQSLSSPTGTCSGSTTTLVPGQSATFTATYTITQADLNNGSVNDSATASGTPPNGSPVNSTPSTATVTLTPTVQITITTSPANLLVSADGGTFTAAPLVESWIIGSAHTIATTSPQSGGAGVQYVWSNWSDSGAISHGITVPSTATSYTASFNTQYQLTTAASPANGGSVSPASSGFYNAGTVVPLQATPAAGHAFVNWTSSPGSVASPSSASTSITMNAPESVTANFAAVPKVKLTPTSIAFGQVYLNASRMQNVTVKNIGDAPLTITDVSLTLGAGTNPGDFSFNNHCPSSLRAGTSCEIEVLLSAADSGTLSATLNIADNAAGSPQEVSVSATVINPEGSFNPTSLLYGPIKVGKNRTLQTTFTNTGTTTLNIDSIAVTGADQGDFTQTNGCPSSLGPGDNCITSVTFAPSATGTRSAFLVVTDNAQHSTQQAFLGGSGK